MPLPRALARFNRVVTNHVTMPFAARLPGFGVVIHRGRKSGREYRTPVNAFRRPGGWELPLTYGVGDWVRNVLASGEADLATGGRTRRFANPRIVAMPGHPALPFPVRWILARLHVDQSLLVDDAAQGGP